MKRQLTILITFLQVFHFTMAITSPYCWLNRTETVHITVNKTREVKLPQPWYKKLSKPKTMTEYYEEDEIVPKVVSFMDCCKGYNMSDLRLCEPICSEGCPENSKCVEPEICKCSIGYYSTLSEHDRKHYCEPICKQTCPEHSICVKPNECACHAGYRLTENKMCQPHCPSGCPYGGQCIEPNHCQCSEGYQAEKGTCLPKCSLGDGCKNGICLDVNVCQCNKGYVLNRIVNICEPRLAIFSSDLSAEETATEDEDEVDTTTLIYLNENSHTFRMDEEYDDEGRTENLEEVLFSKNKCPDDYVLYRGKCQPLKFALDEIDCRLEPCSDVHAYCTENGTCACPEGYRWFRKIVNSTRENKESQSTVVKPECITLEEYQNITRLATDDEDLHVKDKTEHANADATTEEGSGNITSIFFTVLGVLVLITALVYLGLRLLRSGRTEADVEGKNMACAYDSRVATDAEKSVI